MFCSSLEHESARWFCDIYLDITEAVYKTGCEITINFDIDLPSVVYCHEPDQDRRKNTFKIIFTIFNSIQFNSTFNFHNLKSTNSHHRAANCLCLASRVAEIGGFISNLV